LISLSSSFIQLKKNVANESIMPFQR